jgi:hypothetical protein
VCTQKGHFNYQAIASFLSHISVKILIKATFSLHDVFKLIQSFFERKCQLNGCIISWWRATGGGKGGGCKGCLAVAGQSPAVTRSASDGRKGGEGSLTVAQGLEDHLKMSQFIAQSLVSPL